MIRILLVEDDPHLQALVVNNLHFEGFDVAVAGDGERALALHRERPADLVVLDLMLPGRDGFSVLQALRDGGDAVPVLMLTSRGEEADRVRGLRGGADDYVVKPFSVVELVARIRAILRRARPAESTRTSNLLSGPFRIHRLRLQAYAVGRSLNLTNLEFKLLEALADHAGAPLSREELIQVAWGEDAPSSQRTLNVHIANLRRKLTDAAPGEWIVTVGRAGRSGYQWSEAVQAEGE